MDGRGPAGGGLQMVEAGPGRPGEPVLRWQSRARSIEQIEKELARIWAEPNLVTEVEGVPQRHIAARTSVMNLVVIARRAETGERAAATISALTGRHPSRTLVVSTADPDGPSWLDAQIQAHCVLPRADAAETCAEFIYLTCGGESGRHLDAVVAPLLIHDLPVAIWWPGEPLLGTAQARELVAMADRVIVDGSQWSGSGLERLRHLAGLVDDPPLGVWDFALVRQARWREAIASTFDVPEFLPYVRSLRRISVTYATHDETGGTTSTNLVKPVYHVSWLASRLGLQVSRPLTPVAAGKKGADRGLSAALRAGRSDVSVIVRPVVSPMPSGTTLRVELLAERRGSELRIDVTAEANDVGVRAWEDGVEALSRRFKAPRKTDVDLLAEAIEAPGRDPVACEAIVRAAELSGEISP